MSEDAEAHQRGLPRAVGRHDFEELRLGNRGGGEPLQELRPRTRTRSRSMVRDRRAVRQPRGPRPAWDRLEGAQKPVVQTTHPFS